MIGTSILKLIPEHLHSDEKTIIENIRAGRRVEHFETVRVTRGGKLIDVSLTVSPVKDANGQVIGASKILRDVSDRKRLEQSLLQAEKIAATGRMAATIAHEINNPLEAVMNYFSCSARRSLTKKAAIISPQRRVNPGVSPISPSRPLGTTGSTRQRVWPLSKKLRNTPS
jgi:signal transduction histidine kinase